MAVGWLTVKQKHLINRPRHVTARSKNRCINQQACLARAVLERRNQTKRTQRNCKDSISLMDNPHHQAVPAGQNDSITAKRRKFTNHRRVLIINTGGTMGMKQQQDGSLAPVPGYLTEQIKAMPEMKRDSMPAFQITEYDPLIDSSDMTAEHWNLIAKDIEQAYYDFDGFVVVHGTDTMAYTAAALSFMLENLAKPVILTGSMVPFANVYTDGRMNLITSVLIASTVDVPEVCLFFHGKLYRGNRAQKISTTNMEAFTSPNFPPLAELGTELAVKDELILPQPKGRFRTFRNLSNNIVFMRLLPGFDDEMFELLANHSQNLKALVIEVYGTGNVPSRKERFISALRQIHGRGIIIVATTQCISGSVDMTAYAVARSLVEIGVVGALDMTPAAIAAKLGYLIGKSIYSNNQIEDLMQQSMRGELTDPVTKRSDRNEQKLYANI